MANEPHTDSTKSDVAVLRALASLPSYDVYSLRLSLRDLGFSVSNIEDLALSERKIAALMAYMTTFTRPLTHDIQRNQQLAGGCTEFVPTDMRQGMENIENFELTAPKGPQAPEQQSAEHRPL